MNVVIMVIERYKIQDTKIQDSVSLFAFLPALKDQQNLSAGLHHSMDLPSEGLRFCLYLLFPPQPVLHFARLIFLSSPQKLKQGHIYCNAVLEFVFMTFCHSKY